MNDESNAEDYIHYLAKRRFLPTRREMPGYFLDDSSPEHESDDSHLYSKRYFLKSKRYFLNSKWSSDRLEFEINVSPSQLVKLIWSLIFVL